MKDVSALYHTTQQQKIIAPSILMDETIYKLVTSENCNNCGCYIYILHTTNFIM